MNKLANFTLNNNNDVELKVSNYGAIIMSLKVPNKKRTLINIVVGLKKVGDYI
jgi:aldose 1-epimerase